jgi:hypothetical protein
MPGGGTSDGIFKTTEQRLEIKEMHLFQKERLSFCSF